MRPKKSTEPEVNEVIEEEYKFMATGLNTGLKPTFWIKTAKHGSDNLEGFLTVVGKTLIKEDFKRRRFELQNRKTVEIYDVLQELKNPDASESRQKKLTPQEWLKSKIIKGGSLTISRRRPTSRYDRK